MSTHGGGPAAGRSRAGGGGGSGHAAPPPQEGVTYSRESAQATVVRSPTAEPAMVAIFGRSLLDAEVASLVGAPADAHVTVASTEEGVLRLRMYGPNESYSAVRSIRIVPSIGIVIENESIGAKKRGTGLGTRILGRQAKYAAALGVRELRAEASRLDGPNGEPGGSMNGYYTWPALGYNTYIPRYVLSSMPPVLQDALLATRPNPTVLDLFDLGRGAQNWWRQHGPHGLRMVFDPRPGSRSRQWLGRKLAERGVSWTDL